LRIADGVEFMELDMDDPEMMQKNATAAH